jgi:hypothetical protein
MEASPTCAREGAKISSCGQASTSAETWYAKYTLRAICELPYATPASGYACSLGSSSNFLLSCYRPAVVTVFYRLLSSDAHQEAP